jgi:hypothetical protein
MADITIGGILVGAAAAIGGAYLARRGQNVADKQDVRDLTRLVEEVRAEARVTEARTRAIFAKDTATHIKRFEVELPVYQELWNKFVDLEDALSHVQVASEVGITTDKRSALQASAAFRERLAALQSSLKRLEPFFSEEVNKAIKISALPLRMIAATASASASQEEREAKIKVQAKAVVDAMGAVSDAIRARLVADATAVASQPGPTMPVKTQVIVRHDA